MMPPREDVPQLYRWIGQNVIYLKTVWTKVRSPKDAQRFKSLANRFIRDLNAKDHAVVAALEAVQQEVAAGRPHGQHQTTWARRLAQLEQETAGYNQVRAAIRAQKTAVRKMIAQLDQSESQQQPRPEEPAVNRVEKPAADHTEKPAVGHPEEPAADRAEARQLDRSPTRAPPAVVIEEVQTAQPLPQVQATTTTRLPAGKRVIGLGLVLGLFFCLAGVLLSRSPGASTTKATATSRAIVTIAASSKPTQESATEEADFYRAKETAAAVAITPSADVRMIRADTVTPQPPPTPTLVPQPTSSPTPTPPPSATPTPAPMVLGNANLRAGPGTNYPIVGSLSAGDRVTIVERNPTGDWYRLASGVWIIGELLSAIPAGVPIAAIIPPAPLPTATATRIPPTATPILVIRPTTAPVSPGRSCCVTCRTGKACGNSCIARNLTCHQPPGCACDG